MNFDNFDGIDIVDKTSLLRNCKSAERNIMISPYNAIANSRAALEILCKGLIKKNNVEQIKPQPKICKNCNMPIEDTLNLPPNLATMNVPMKMAATTTSNVIFRYFFILFYILNYYFLS